MTKKADALVLKQARGTKRTCQNSDCGVRFYDLGRTPIACPVCAAPYIIPSSPAPLAAQPRKPKRPEYPVEEAIPAETAPADPEATHRPLIHSCQHLSDRRVAFAEREEGEVAQTAEDVGLGKPHPGLDPRLREGRLLALSRGLRGRAGRMPIS